MKENLTISSLFISNNKKQTNLEKAAKLSGRIECLGDMMNELTKI